MQVTFDLRPEDHLAWAHHFVRHTPQGRAYATRSAARVGILFGAVVVVLSLVQGAPLALGLLVALLFGGLGFLVVTVGMAPSNRMDARDQLHGGRNVGVLGTRTVSLTDAGPLLESDAGRNELRWWALEGVFRSDRHIFLAYGQQAVVVPRRAFANGYDADTFYGAALRYHSLAQGRR
jgi:hypothetical protein